MSSTTKPRAGACKKCLTKANQAIQIKLLQDSQQDSQKPENRVAISVSSVSIVEVGDGTSDLPNVEAEQAVEMPVNATIDQESQPTPSMIHVSKLDANEYLQWQWEKLVSQLTELDKRCPDGCSVSMSELNDYPSPSSPLAISEGALSMYTKAKELGSLEWANRFLMLIGHRILTISRGRLFLSLSPDEVIEVLGSDYLDVDSEMSVLRAAHRWLDHDHGARSSCMPFVMGCVRYGLMAKEDIIKCVVTRRHLRKCMLNMPPFQQAITKGLVWMCMKDLSVEANFPDFEQIPRIHSGLNTRASVPSEDPMHYEGSSNSRDLPADLTICQGQAQPKKGTHVVSQVTTMELKAGPSGGRQQAGRGGRYN